MFGMGFGGSHRGGHWAGGRHGRGRWGRRGGGDEMQGRGGGDFMRAGRMLAQGDLRLIALALIAEQPRHGYDLIKQLEEKTSGWYSPSPGIVYPTLTYLEESGHLTSQADGAKKLYTITEEGRAYLEENREVVDAVMSRLAYIGKKAKRMRERFGEEEDRRGSPPLVKAALDNLREVAAKRLAGDPRSEARIVEILARAAGELRDE
jgi:DNA-binding PadR family transcriptional regulator